jgi:hypothetical protein
VWGVSVKPLVLTGWLIPDFIKSDFADLAVQFPFHFVWGQLPSPDELAFHLGHRSADHGPGEHWSDFAYGWEQSKNREPQDCGLLEFCQHYETVELWFDTRPDAQLQLVWLLDYFRSHPDVVARLRLRLLDLDLIDIPLGKLARFTRADVRVREHELETAQVAWQAYRAATPEACFDLLSKNLSRLPLFKPVLRDLLHELPSVSTGLGATEMRMLELIARGYAGVNSLFHLRELRQTRIFNEWQHGYLLDGLAFGPTPAVAGLDDELRKISREELGKRHPLYLKSRLSLTEFGKAVVAHEVDFSRHNPIDRWWGGTHLTNDRLWRFDPVLTKP